MIPVLLVMSALHRILTFANLDKKATEFDFTDTIQKLRDHQSNSFEAYDLTQDTEQARHVMSEISTKGLVPFEYQLDFFNFMIFWYFFAGFIV